jgi:hypothetical protein
MTKFVPLIDKQENIDLHTPFSQHKFMTWTKTEQYRPSTIYSVFSEAGWYNLPNRGTKKQMPIVLPTGI